MGEPRILFDDETGPQLGNVICRARKDRRITQANLATLSKMTPATLRRIEYGAGAVRLDTLLEVARNLGLDLRIETTPSVSPAISLQVRYFECAHCSFEFIAREAVWCPKCGFEGSLTAGLFEETLVLRW